MKTKYFKSSVLFAVFAMLFVACDSDRDDNPKLGPNHTAKTFVVNTSAVADQYIQLSPENTVNLTWTQPDYGVNTVVNYKVQVGLNENGTEKWGDFLESGFTSCNVNLSGEEIAKVLCKLDGFKTEDDYIDMGFREVIMRVTANIQTTTSQEIDGTSITSNTVSFKHMAAYCNIPSKGTLYVIGTCSGWPEPSGSNKQTLIDGGWFITETEIGSNVFKGVVEMPEGDLTFRFYSKLTGWGSDDAPEGSIGHQAKDEAKEFTLPHSGTCMPGKGSWTFLGFPGGKLDITVDMNNRTVKFELLN
jgi:hypothetical protein